MTICNEQEETEEAEKIKSGYASRQDWLYFSVFSVASCSFLAYLSL